MQPLAPHLRSDPRAEERLAISFDEEYSDIGNIDYTQPSVSYRGERGIQGEKTEDRNRCESGNIIRKDHFRTFGTASGF